ncbi:MAG: galactokinase family protein [Candidatus Brocadiia bacterium]
MQSRDIETLKSEAARRAGESTGNMKVVRSPYRVCPLGAHVDHQLGEVTGMALDEALHLAFIPCTEPVVRIDSHNFEGTVQFRLDEIPEDPPGDWADYLRGAAWALQQECGLSRGFYGLVSGRENVGGLSSSAAVGVAYLMALEEANDLERGRWENIELDRRIENDYIGLNNGLLDQSSILLSRRRHLMHLDCRSEEAELYPYGGDEALHVVVLYSGLTRQLSGTDYNRRVDECREAAGILLENADIEHGGRTLLREVPRKVYLEHREALPDRLRRRAAHYFGEQQRVHDGIRAWKEGDLARFGRLVTQSGWSSVENYECGNAYLRSAFEVLDGTDGVLGARFSGAGFRGCSIGIMGESPADDLRGDILRRYCERHPDMDGQAEVYFCRPGDGAELIE